LLQRLCENTAEHSVSFELDGGRYPVTVSYLEKRGDEKFKQIYDPKKEAKLVHFGGHCFILRGNIEMQKIDVYFFYPLLCFTIKFVITSGFLQFRPSRFCAVNFRKLFEQSPFQPERGVQFCRHEGNDCILKKKFHCPRPFMKRYGIMCFMPFPSKLHRQSFPLLKNIFDLSVLLRN